MITFTLAMHGPFHVSTGTPDEGMDSPIDLACPLPSTSLKGLLRAEATERLDIPQPVIDEIFTVSPDLRPSLAPASASMTSAGQSPDSLASGCMPGLAAGPSPWNRGSGSTTPCASGIPWCCVRRPAA